MKDEKKLNIVLDNAKIHSAKIVLMMCDVLSINLVFLPHYSPFLSPIEQVWKDIKRDIYISSYNTLEELIKLFNDKFYEKIESETYYEGWIKKFLE